MRNKYKMKLYVVKYNFKLWLKIGIGLQYSTCFEKWAESETIVYHLRKSIL